MSKLYCVVALKPVDRKRQESAPKGETGPIFKTVHNQRLNGERGPSIVPQACFAWPSQSVLRSRTLLAISLTFAVGATQIALEAPEGRFDLRQLNVPGP